MTPILKPLMYQKFPIHRSTRGLDGFQKPSRSIAIFLINNYLAFLPWYTPNCRWYTHNFIGEILGG
jgi:hypothetical protein